MQLHMHTVCTPCALAGARKDALDRVAAEVTRLGGVLEPPDASKRGTALYATFEETSGVDKAIFWFPCAPSLNRRRRRRHPSTGADTRSPGTNLNPHPRRENEKIIHFRSERPAEPVWDGEARRGRVRVAFRVTVGCGLG